MTRLRSIALLGLLLLAALQIWQFQDDDPSPESQAWLAAELERRSPVSAEYLYLLGLAAPADVAPKAYGQQRLEAYQAWLNSGAQGAWIDPPAALSNLADSNLCELAEASCQLDSQTLAQVLNQHATLLTRYQQWLRQPSAYSAAAPTAEEPLPLYSLLLDGQRLDGFEQALQPLTDAQKQQHLLGNIADLRRHLAGSDSLIHKMVVTRLLSTEVNRLALLQWQNPKLDPISLAPLTAEELSFTALAQREYAGMAGLLQQLNAHQADVPSWQMHYFYKPQRSVNQALPRYQALAASVEQPASALGQTASVDSLDSPIAALIEDPRNPVGAILLSVAGPSPEVYAARLHDLQARINLLNLSNSLPADERQWPKILLNSPISNPYQAGQPPYWDTEQQTLCFSGPLEDKNGVRCLTLKRG